MSEMNRRGFLKKSAALGAAALSGSIAYGQENRRPLSVTTPRRGPNDELRVACIGIRGQGNTHLRNHASAPNVRVVTICDIDENLYAKAIQTVESAGGAPPRTEPDIRRVLEDKDVDCISIATPNHWHALGAIWACQAGKDVYVEKPLSHNVLEGRRLVEAARRYDRIVQHGTQSRSSPAVQEAMKLLREGVIGDVYMARALCYKRRDSIGFHEDEPAAPEGVHYDLWLGPAPKRPFNRNRFHYEWHWHWDYGNGDIGNQGVHQMDIARWGLSEDLPVRIYSVGGRFTYKDQAETPNTQVCTFQYEDGKMLVFEVRGRQTHDEWGVGIGNLFYGSKGYMAVGGSDFRTMIDGQEGPSGKGGGSPYHNFHEAVRTRDRASLHAEAEEGHYSSALCHLANVAYRLGRSLEFDPKTETFGRDAEANALLTRKYRPPFVVPDRV
jgi:predicted dehydrogenase